MVIESSPHFLEFPDRSGVFVLLQVSIAQDTICSQRHSVPVDSPKQDRRHWLLPVSSGLDASASPPPPEPPVTFSDRIATLDPSLRDLLSSVKLLHSLPEIYSLLRMNQLLTLVGDGDAKTCCGSYGDVAAIGIHWIFTVQGPAPGPDPRSYREEAYAMAALILAVIILLESFCLPAPASLKFTSTVITKVSSTE
jgi:hypothetical protein